MTKKFIRDYFDEMVRSKSETRDAVLWEVLPDQRLALVKIQTSNKLIVANYPLNLEKTPVCLKRGNVVKILHTGGERGRIEVIGHGQLLPTPVAGAVLGPWTDISFEETGNHILSVTTDFTTLGLIANDRIVIAGSTSNNGTFTVVTAAAHDIIVAEAITDEIAGDPVIITLLTDMLPMPATPSDAVVTGGHVGVPDTFGMSVKVDAASYRINGVTYSSSVTTLALSAAPSVGHYRYDVIYGDINGTVHIQEGTSATSNPVFPSIPGNTVQLGYILVYGGMTEVTVVYTNREWTAPVPTTVTVVPTDGDLAWTELSTVVRVSVFDQYGNPITTTSPGWYLTLEFQTVGNGTLHSAEEGDSTTKIGGHAGSHNYYDFTYTRDQLTTDISPALKGICEADHSVSGFVHILLRDAYGNPMSGQSTPTDYFKIIHILTSAANVTVDWSLASVQRIVIDRDVVFTFTGAMDGARLVLIVRQDGSGNHNPSWPATVRYGSDIPSFTLTQTADKEDYLGFIFDGDASKYDLVAVVKGY